MKKKGLKYESGLLREELKLSRNANVFLVAEIRRLSKKNHAMTEQVRVLGESIEFVERELTKKSEQANTLLYCIEHWKNKMEDK